MLGRRPLVFVSFLLRETFLFLSCNACELSGGFSYQFAFVVVFILIYIFRLLMGVRSSTDKLTKNTQKCKLC